MPLPSDPIDPPVLSMTFAANSSPLSGQEGSLLSLVQIKERLEKECQHNVAIRVFVSSISQKFFRVYGDDN